MNGKGHVDATNHQQPFHTKGPCYSSLQHWVNVIWKVAFALLPRLLAVRQGEINIVHFTNIITDAPHTTHEPAAYVGRGRWTAKLTAAMVRGGP